MSRSAPRSCANNTLPPLTSRRMRQGSRRRFATHRATGPALRRGRACSLCTKMKIRNRRLCSHIPTRVGATTDQIAALFVLLGDERARAFMHGLHENGVKVSPSNGDSADLVARGQFAFSLVDSDDVVNRMKQHEPVTMVYPDQGANEIGCLIVPNAAVLIAGSPHQDAGMKLIDYLLRTETERKLAFSDAAQIPLHPHVATPPGLQPIESIKITTVDYAAIATKLQAIQSFLKNWAGS